MPASPRTVLITGANAGLGKEVARQLALRPHTAKIYLACRNETKAAAAQADLETSTGKSTFEIVILDVTDLASVRAAVTALTAPLDAVIMNAGGSGGPSAMTLTPDGATNIFAANVLGHVVLLEELIKANQLTDVALYVGSEAARGIPKFRMQRPSFPTSSSDEFASVIDGSYFHATKPDPTLAYGQAKYLGALWMSALARQHPDLRFITMSPGSTSGTEGPNSLPLPMRLAAKYVMPVIGPRLGIAHPVATGAQRLVDGITDPTLRSGTFYASAANTITGPVVDQAGIFGDLANPAYQDNAEQAIHRFIPRQWDGLVTTLADALALARSENGLGVVSTLRTDASIQSSLVNAGVVTHPVSGAQVVAFVTAGAVKLANLRVRPAVTTTFRSGWQWATVEGHAELAGPDDRQPWLDPERLRLLLREVFVGAGGTHDDWDEYDRVMAAERRTAVLITPGRIYGNN